MNTTNENTLVNSFEQVTSHQYTLDDNASRHIQHERSTIIIIIEGKEEETKNLIKVAQEMTHTFGPTHIYSNKKFRENNNI